MEAYKEILSRLLPKTGQITSYYFKDDGELQLGWWKGLLYADNKERFIQQTINGDVVVIDRATGLMWAADSLEGGCGDGVSRDWELTMGIMPYITFAGFSDWVVPNVLQLFSISNLGKYNPAIDEPPFINTFVTDTVLPLSYTIPP